MTNKKLITAGVVSGVLLGLVTALFMTAKRGARKYKTLENKDNLFSNKILNKLSGTTSKANSEANTKSALA